MVRYLLLIFMLTGCSASYGTTPVKEHHISDGVMYIEDVPKNECRYVMYPPRPVDRMQLPEPKLMCNTFGVVLNEDVRPTKG